MFVVDGVAAGCCFNNGVLVVGFCYFPVAVWAISFRWGGYVKESWGVVVSGYCGSFAFNRRRGLFRGGN